jgi:hypothetical protein
MRAHRLSRGMLLVVGVWILSVFPSRAETGRALAGHKLLPTTRQAPEEFGTLDYTVTTISATSFLPEQDTGIFYYTSLPSFGRTVDLNQDQLSFATLNVPAGAVIDYVGLNTATDTDSVIGVELAWRNKNAVIVPIASFSAPAHGWDTDYNATPIGWQVVSNLGAELVIEVENAPNPNPQYFGWVEIWWRRTVSPPPSTASFVDVPTTSPIFRFVEALKASGITAGCDATHYCPNANLTRGQMAVFLATALGLHWPN